MAFNDWQKKTRRERGGLSGWPAAEPKALSCGQLSLFYFLTKENQ
jgi:hypothetical protein